MTQMDLLYMRPIVTPLHHRNDPTTSREAAKEIAKELGLIQRQVLHIIKVAREPITAEQVHEEYCRRYRQCGYSTARTRVGELHRLGLISRRRGLVTYKGRKMMGYTSKEGAL